MRFHSRDEQTASSVPPSIRSFLAFASEPEPVLSKSQHVLGCAVRRETRRKIGEETLPCTLRRCIHPYVIRHEGNERACYVQESNAYTADPMHALGDRRAGKYIGEIKEVVIDLGSTPDGPNHHRLDSRSAK